MRAFREQRKVALCLDGQAPEGLSRSTNLAGVVPLYSRGEQRWRSSCLH